MTAIGTLGAPWRAHVSAWGGVEVGGGPGLDWWVAADDRWHTPRTEASRRQHLLGGTPVMETAIRVPGGDAIQRVYAVADAGGLVVIEVENASPLPLAVAFNRGDLLSARPAASASERAGIPPPGIELPPGSMSLPVGHRTTVRAALPIAGRGPGRLPPVPTSAQVVNGWLAQAGRGVRIEGLDDTLAERLVTARCRLLLDGPAPQEIDRGGFVLGVAELVRLGEPAAAWIDVVAEAAIKLAKAARRGREVGWDVQAAVDAAAEVLARGGEQVGAADAAAIAAALPPARLLPADAPADLDPARFVAWVLRRLVVPSLGGAAVLPDLPPAWRGRNLAVYEARVPQGTVSFALRWHGEHPALLWQLSEPFTLRAPALAPAWSTTSLTGEELLAADRAG